MLVATSAFAEAPTTTAAQTPAEGFAEFRRLLDAKQYDQAVVQAQKLVDETAQGNAPGEDQQVALMNLAVAQYFAGDYIGAEGSYQKVIGLIESSDRPTNPRLARAEAGLAATYYQGKRYDLAVQHFDRAVALSRRSEGLFNEAQLPLLEKYADSLTQVNRLQDALKVRRYSLRVVERKYGENSLRFAQELESIGRWYAKVRAYDAARGSLRRAIDLVEELKGDNAPELIGPLTGLAECDRRQLLDPTMQQLGSPDEQRAAMFHDSAYAMAPALAASSIAVEGQKALEQAVAIASGRPDTPRAQLASVQTQFGDWYQSRQQTDRSTPLYQQAWQSATGQTLDGKPLTDVLFGRPVLLHYSPPDSWDRYFGRPAEEVTVKNTQVEFVVTAQGRVANPQVIADAGDPKLGAQAAKAALAARYRPRFEKGQPVDTAGVRLDQVFWVLVDSEPKPEPKPATKPESAPRPEPTTGS